MSNGNYIKLNRSILDWEWYDDINVARVFIHILLTANYKAKRWHGIQIERGQRVISISGLAEETGLTVQQTRTALDKLIATGELTKSATSRYTLITVENYNKFQDVKTDNNKPSNMQPNKQATNKQQTNNNNIRNKESKEGKELKNTTPLTPQGEMETIVNQLPLELRSTVHDFIDHRKKMRKPLTVKALKMMLKKLNELSSGDSRTSIEILEQSIINGWAGVFPLPKGRLQNKPRNEALEMLKRGVFDDEEGNTTNNNIFEGSLSERNSNN